jgi:TonB family protein
MSLLKSTLESPVAATPFNVRLEPYLVESICELARLVRDKGNQQRDISGLLFGTVDDGNRTAVALKTFVDSGSHSELARRERWEKAYRATLDESKNDAELSEFEVVGWFSFRTGSGLLSSDIVFHNQHFRRPEDIALMVWREGPSQITVEVYAKSENDALTSDDYRWGSVRLSADIRHMREPVGLSMRVKLSDDSFLRTYDSGEAPSGLENLRRKAEAVSERLIGLVYRRKQEPRAEGISGYIGDGRVPNGDKPGSERPEETAAAPTFFNPYAEAALARSRAQTNEAPKPDARNGVPTVEPAPQPATPQPVNPQPVNPQPVNPQPVNPQPGYPQPAYPQQAYPQQAYPQQAYPWVGTGTAFGVAPAPVPPARLPQPPRLPEPSSYQASPFPPQALVPSATEFGNIGRAPRTARAPQAEVSGVPMVLRPTVPQKTFPWALAAALFMVSSGLVFAFFAMGGLHSDGGRIGQIFQSVFPGGDLNLRVRNEDDRLRLTWNQRNHVVSSATDATLQIFDGAQHRDVHLDGRQVEDGSVLYKPQTNDVTFRLEVRGEQGAVSGSIRLLDGLTSQQQPVLDVSAPAQTPLAAAPLPLQNSAAAVPPTPYREVPAPNSGAPTLLRDDSTALASDQAYAPVVTGSTTYPPVRTPSRYETPQSVGQGGTTINGWDTPVSTRTRAKRKYAPVFPSVGAPASAGYTPPRPLMQVMPNTHSIPNGTIQARTRVEVQVDVDQQGHVAAARVVGGEVNESIASSALAAARQWTFDPASNNGHRIDSEHTILFEFRPEAH